MGDILGGALSWLDEYFIVLITYIVSALIGAFITLILQTFFEGRLRTKAFFLGRKLRLRFTSGIEMEFRRSANFKSEYVNEVERHAEVQRIVKAAKDAMSAEFHMVEKVGESTIRGRDSQTESINFECHFDAMIDEGAPSHDALLTITVKTTTPYPMLSETLIGLFGQADRLREVISGAGIMPSFTFGQASITVKMRKKPTVLEALSKLEVSDFTAQHEGYGIHFSEKGIVFRGNISKEMAMQVKDLVTWYY